MKETELYNKIELVRKRAKDAGITLIIGKDEYYFNDIPAAGGRVIFETIEEVALFVHGYELGYRRIT